MTNNGGQATAKSVTLGEKGKRITFNLVIMNFRKLRADEIECRVGTEKKNSDGSVKGCSILLYKDARCDMRLLDEVVGANNWKRRHKLIGDNLYCEVSIYDEAKHEWVSKEDVGTESRTEAEKGQASDSFKRACFNWGIGRELYTAPFIWLEGKAPYGLHCQQIDYDDNGNINKLVLCDGKGVNVYTYGMKPSTPKPISKPIIDVIKDEASKATTQDELMKVFNAHKDEISKDENLRVILTNRRKELNNAC